MSLFKSILGVAAPVIGGFFGGPVGAAIGTAVGGAINKPKISLAASPAPAISPQLTMGALPMLGRALPMIGAAGAAVVAGGRAIARSAMTYCRRHPAWCAQIGGTAAIAGMIESGQLPTIRHRRGRGITPGDLRSFRRVANLVRGYCPTVRRIPPKALHVRGTGITHA